MISSKGDRSKRDRRIERRSAVAERLEARFGSLRLREKLPEAPRLSRFEVTACRLSARGAAQDALRSWRNDGDDLWECWRRAIGMILRGRRIGRPNTSPPIRCFLLNSAMAMELEWSSGEEFDEHYKVTYRDYVQTQREKKSAPIR